MANDIGEAKKGLAAALSGIDGAARVRLRAGEGA